MGKQQNAKKGKKRRVPQAKIQYYWSHCHVPNMLRKAVRIARKEGHAAADRFVSLHSLGCRACQIILDAKFSQLKEV